MTSLAIDLVGQPVIARGGQVSGVITGVYADDPAFLLVQFSNGWTGDVRIVHARAALASGEKIVAAIDTHCLRGAAKSARTMLNDIRAGKPVPPSASVRSIISDWQAQQSKATAEAATKPSGEDGVIAAWQAAQPGKQEDAAKIVAEHGSSGFKSAVKREIEAQIAPAKGGAKIVQLVKHCGKGRD